MTRPPFRILWKPPTYRRQAPARFVDTPRGEVLYCGVRGPQGPERAGVSEAMSAPAPDVMARVKVDLRRTWLVWSVLPLVVFLLALLACTAVYASAPVLSQKRSEDSFYMFLAVSALVFLIAFTIDGYWTNPKRVTEALLRGAGPSAAGELASRMVVTSASALGLMGQAIGAGAILCLLGGAGVVNAYLVLSLAISYHLFLLSRHPYYEQVVEAAQSGEFAPEKQAERKTSKN